MNIFKKYTVVFYLLLFSACIYAEPVRINDKFDHVSLGKYLYILEDPSGSLSFSRISSGDQNSGFRISESEEPNFGFTSSVYWVKFDINSSAFQNQKLFLELSYPLIDNIELYTPVKNSWIVKKSGDHLAFNTRDINHRNFIFSLNPEPGSHSYYMRFQTSSSMNLPLTLWSEKALINKIGTEQIIFGIFFGSVILMLIYNVFLFIGFREISFIYLLMFIGSWGFAQFTIDGFSYQYLWSGLTWWSDINLPVFIFTSLAAAVQFCRSLLNSSKLFPAWDKVLRIEKNVFMAGILVSCFLPYAISIKLATGFAIPAIISLSITGIAGMKIHNRSAAIFMTAWGLFLAGAILFAVKSFGLFPSNYLTNFGIQIGFFAMMILLSVAVQDRVETEKKEKQNVQQQLIEALKQSERILEKKAEERTQEINRINIMLMDRAIELAGINQLTEKINSSLKLSDVLMFACEEFVKIFEVKYSSVYLLDEHKNKFELACFFSNEENQAGSLSESLSLEIITKILELKVPVSFSGIPGTSDKGNVLIVPVILLKKVIGIILLPAADPDHEFSKDEIDLAKTMAVQAASAVQNARQFSETEIALDVAEKDLEIGREIQSGFFPPEIKKITGWDIAAYFKGAKQVAGDFYDVFPLDNSRLTAVIIADVCDKGVGAALFMVVFRSLLRAYSENNITADNIQEGLKNVLSMTNNYIAKNHTSSNMFASIFFGVINNQGAEIFYINAGHDEPAVIDKSGNILKRLQPTGPVAGMFPGMNFDVECVKMEPGDLLFTYTDGSADARNYENKPFKEEPLLQTASQNTSSAYSMLFSINSRLRKHIGKTSQFDDITQLCIRREISDKITLHKIMQEAVPGNLEEMRNFVEGAARYENLPEEMIFDFKLASEEICTNVINYGFAEQEGTLTISFERSGETAYLKIYDNGKHFPPEDAVVPDITAEAESRKIGGLGIYFVRKLMDIVDYQQLKGGLNLLILGKKIF